MEAYVLLAEPGGGKSEAFKREAAAASYVLARDFCNAGPPEGWNGEPLFIDGFDQMRADSASRNTPLDQIVQKLDAVGRPRFRICCREADWLSSDQSALRAVSRGDVGVLHLDPLTDEEVLLLLRRRGDRVLDAQAFVERPPTQESRTRSSGTANSSRAAIAVALTDSHDGCREAFRACTRPLEARSERE